MVYIDNSSLILIIGMNNSNKYYIIKDLLYNHKTIPIGVVISKDKSNKYDYIPQIFIHEEYNKKIIKNLIKSEQTSESFFIYDNYNGQKDKYLDKLFQKSYSLRIFDMQYIARHSNSHTPTKLINNVEYLIILQEDLQINRMKIYEEFKDNLKIEFTLFCKFLDEYTDNNHALIIHLLFYL